MLTPITPQTIIENNKEKIIYNYASESNALPENIEGKHIILLFDVNGSIAGSNDYVYAQLAKLEEYPCKQVKFLDRTFNSHPKRALAIAEYINKLFTLFKIVSNLFSFISHAIKWEKYSINIWI